MQAVHKLYINNAPIELLKHDVTRELSAIGRAFFSVKPNEDSPLKVGQIVIYDYGFKGKNLVRFFIGLVQSITPQGSGVYSFKAREITALLLSEVNLVLRHVTMEAVISTLGKKTGLNFVHSNAAYWKTETPFYYSLGTGREALNMVKEAFSLDDFCWQQQADGSIFVGLISELPASAQNFNLDFSICEAMGTDGAWRVSMVPGLLPGAMVSGYKINSINISSNKMVLKCITQ